MKGILIEKRSRKSIIMDQKGRFVSTRTMKGWSEGDEVIYTSNSVKAARGISIAATFLLVFALGLFAVYANNSYTVNLDVNPSIAIEVNAFNNVTAIEALNDDAEQIGDLSTLVGMKVGPAVNQAILMLLAEGYLEADGTVVLSIDGKNNKVKTVVREVSEAVEDALVEGEEDEEDEDEKDGEPKLKIYVGRITAEMAAAAEDLGVPYGRIVLAAKAQEEGAAISYETAAMLSVQELQRIRNLSKTISKANVLQAEASQAKEGDNGKGNEKQFEALSKKIIKEASRIEDNIDKLMDEINAGEADADTVGEHAALTAQLNILRAQMGDIGVVAGPESDEKSNNGKGPDNSTDKGNSSTAKDNNGSDKSNNGNNDSNGNGN